MHRPWCTTALIAVLVTSVSGIAAAQDAEPTVPSSSTEPTTVLAPVAIGTAPTSPTTASVRDAERAASTDREVMDRTPPPRVRRPYEPLPRNVIAWQPLSLLFASWDFEYERVFERHVSAYLATSLVFAANDRSGEVQLYGFAGDLGARIYPWGNAPDGLFLQPYVGMETFADQYFTRSRGLGYRLGILAGYSVVIARHAYLSWGQGFEYVNFTRSGYTSSWPAVTLRGAIGVVF